MNLRALHRASACLIAAFVVVHVANHLMSLAGIAEHIRFMEGARAIYRQPFIEVVLLAGFCFQGGSGLWLVVANWRQRSGWVAWLQAISGGYLALFLLIHVGAVIFGRVTLGLDTNFYYASAGLHVSPFHYFFVPYYFLAILALFTHIGRAVYWLGPVSLRQRGQVLATFLVAGVSVSALIVLSLSGKLQSFDVPEKYLSTYKQANG